MIRTVILTVLALVALASNAEARERHKPAAMHERCNIDWPCIAPYASTPDQVRVARGRYIAREMGFGTAIKKPVRKARVSHVRAKPAKVAAPVQRIVKAVVGTISGIVTPLAVKVAEIQSSCGSRVVSAVRHTNVAGTRILSLHATGQAVDVAGNPNCIYLLLKGWPGGYSTDYSRVAHVHISFGGREHGTRFVHHHVRRSHHRYASAR